MTAVITGAAIGFLIWAAVYLCAIVLTGHPSQPSMREMFAYAAGGAAIGWLIGGGL